MASAHLLNFAAFPERMVIEGFGEEVVGLLGGFTVRVQPGGTDDPAYRVVAEGIRSRVKRGAAVSGRRPHRRHLLCDGEDRAHMPGCNLRLASGRPVAVVEFSAKKSADGYVITNQLELAMSHALAISGRVVSHAAALEVDGMTLLAVGRTHSGKSTLCAAALAAGGSVVSDDSVILGLDDRGAPSVGALRRNLWLREGSVDILPGDVRSAVKKAVVFGEDRWGVERDEWSDRFRTRVRPEAIVLLHRDRRIRGFKLQDVSAADAAAGIVLASTALFFSSRYALERDRCICTLTAMVDTTPCFSLWMGTDLVNDSAATGQRLVGALRR